MWNYDDQFSKFAQELEDTRQRIAILDTPEAFADIKRESLFEELNVTMEELSVAQEEMQQQNEALVLSRYAAEEATHRYCELFDFAPDAYFVTTPDGVIKEANRAAATLLNAPQEHLTGKPLVVFVDAETRRAFRTYLSGLPQVNGKAVWETRLQPRHRLYVDVQFSVIASLGTGGAKELRWTARDITDKKRDAAQIAAHLERIEAMNTQLETERNRLEERVRERTAELDSEIRVRVHAEERLFIANRSLTQAMIETHHRVKNNLQTIAALIDLQTQDVTDDPHIAPAILNRLTVQVRTLAALHDALTHQAKEDADLDRVPVRALMERLLPLAQQSSGGMDIQANFDEVWLSASQAVALATIANELMSNAAKHGSGAALVTLRAENRRGVLEVCDNGPGFPPDFNSKSDANVGLELVDSMARHDLKGEAQYSNQAKGGAVVRVVFPLPQAE